ncbi:MAG: SHOCT domain-containing protein [Chloroflexota bacterium]
MMGYGFGSMWGLGGFGMLIGWLVWIGLIVLVVWGVASLFPTRREPGQDSALEILKQRFARGEISAAEFQQAKRDLVQ